MRLGDFGTFSLRVRSEGAETEEDVGAKNITKVVAGFRPGKHFQNALDPDVIEFRSEDSKVSDALCELKACDCFQFWHTTKETPTSPRESTGSD